MGHFLYVELPVDTLVPDCGLCIFFSKGPSIPASNGQLVTTDSPMVSNCFRRGGFHPRVHAGYLRLSQLRQEQRSEVHPLRMISRSQSSEETTSQFSILYVYIYIYMNRLCTCTAQWCTLIVPYFQEMTQPSLSGLSNCARWGQFWAVFFSLKAGFFKRSG